jgi:2-iminobutanoate/2-iminopropanoate deaminase
VTAPPGIPSGTPSGTPSRTPSVTNVTAGGPKLTKIETATAPKPIGPYAQAMVASPGELVFTSGMVGNDPQTGALVPGGIEAETEQALSNLAAVLAASGLTFRDVARTTIFLADMADFQAMNAVYARCLDGHTPARSTVAVRALPLGAKVEIDMLAIRSR